MEAKKKPLKPGEKVSRTGAYLDSRGIINAWLLNGRTAPPTRYPSMTWIHIQDAKDR